MWDTIGLFSVIIAFIFGIMLTWAWLHFRGDGRALTKAGALGVKIDQAKLESVRTSGCIAFTGALICIIWVFSFIVTHWPR